MTRRRGTVSLERASSKLGLASRRDARTLILGGRVRVDDERVVDPAASVVPERVHVAIDGVPQVRPRARTIVSNKPRGVVTTRRDPQGRRTVFDVIGGDSAGLVAVGRLDAASTGLLLLTTDTQLANRLIDPEHRLVRRYVVTVRGRVAPADAVRLCDGLEVEATTSRGIGRERLEAGRIAIRKASNRETHLIVELTEGKNREIRRMFAAIGHEVTRLHRIAFGPFELGDLAPGAVREEDVARYRI